LGRIDGLVNNAGIMTKSRRTNTKNIELDLSVNHLGHFLLTALLLDKMLAQPHPVRIVFVGTDIALK
jgi:NAD(P)-dependent dehydrogenase (short-subunit alcohol dehydrogenase family)